MSLLDPNLYQPTMDLDHRYICMICKGAMTDPIKIKCSHNACKTCIETWLNCSAQPRSNLANVDALNAIDIDDVDDDDTIEYPISSQDEDAEEKVKTSSCPYCRQEFSSTDIEPDVALSIDLAQMSFLCPNTCGGKFLVRNLDRHYESCPMTSIECPNSACRVWCFRKDMSKHLKICPFQLQDCRFECGNQFYRDELQKHYDLLTCLRGVPVRRGSHADKEGQYVTRLLAENKALKKDLRAMSATTRLIRSQYQAWWARTHSTSARYCPLCRY